MWVLPASLLLYRYLYMKRNLGNILFIILAATTVLVWTIFPPESEGVENYLRYQVGMTIGSLVITLMSFSLFISAISFLDFSSWSCWLEI